MKKNMHILILEDLPSDAELAVHELKKVFDKFLIHIVETEEDYISALESFQPDLIISDFQLPAFDGLSALKITLEKSSLTPFVILTGSMNEDTAVECLKAGADDYVIKEHIKRLGSAALNAIKKKKIEQDRKNALQALINSEKKYRAIFEATGTATLLVNEKSIIINANSECKSVTGFNQSKLIGKSWTNFVFKDDLKQMLEHAKSRLTSPELVPKKYETRLINAKGNIRNTILSIELIPGTKNSIVSMIDITKRKKAEASIIERDQHLNSIIQNPVGYAIYRLKATRDSLLPIITHVSPSIVDLTGITWDDSSSYSKFLNNVHPDDMDKLTETYKRSMKPPFIFDVECRYLHPSRGLIWLHVRSNGIPYKNNPNTIEWSHGILGDITSRKQIENIQKELYNISKAVNEVDNVRELIMKIREYLGNVLDTSNFFVALYDKKIDMISMPYRVDANNGVETFPIGKTLINYVIKSGKPLFAPLKIQHQLIKEGKIIIVGETPKIWLGCPLKIDKEVIGIIAVQSYDNSHLYTENDLQILSFVSEEIALVIHRKKNDEEIKKNLAEKNTLLREIYHRTKNNMSVVSAMLSMQARRSNNESIKTIFKEINNKIKTMSLVHQKLYKANDLSNINLKEYIEDLIKLIMQSYEEVATSINVTFQMHDVKVLIDTAIPLGLVINELITNIFKHAFPDKKEGEIFMRLFRDKNDDIIIQLSDNGVGLPQNFDGRKIGTMGFISIFSIVENQLQGEISFKSENGLKWYIKIKKNIYKERV